MVQLVLSAEVWVNPRAIMLLLVKGSKRSKLVRLEKATQTTASGVEMIQPERANGSCPPRGIDVATK